MLRLTAILPFAVTAIAYVSLPSSPVPFSDALMVEAAAADALIHWIDDVQADSVSLFAREDHPLLPATPACAWVVAHPEAAAPALQHNLKHGIHLGDAVLAGALGLKDTVPVLVEAWFAVDEAPYNGESSLPGAAELADFRELQGMAYVIEHLTGRPLRESAELTPARRHSLEVRAAEEGGEAARAILAALR